MLPNEQPWLFSLVKHASCDRLLINCVSSTDAVMIEVCLMYFTRSGRRMKAMVSEI